MRQSVVLILAPARPARWFADNLVPGGGHPQFQSGVTRVVLRGRPYAQPVRAFAGAGTDQVQGLRAFPGLGCRAMPEQHERGPYLRASAAQMYPADSVTPAADPV